MENKSCNSCGTAFNVSEAEKSLSARIAPQIGGTSFELPSPVECPACRRQKRLAFRNERALYKRKCDSTGDTIISTVSPDKPNKVYQPSAWWGDSWEGADFGVPYDPKRPMFEQIRALRERVPMMSLSVVNCENCDFNNDLTNSRNCYYTFGAENCEDTYYSLGSINLKDCVDVWWSDSIELSAYIFSGKNLFDCLYSDNCGDSQNLIFCRDCGNCSNCFGCANLTRKEYHIFNVPYEKEEYEKTIESFNRGSYKQILSLRKQADEFFMSQYYPATYLGEHSENSTGDLLFESTNCVECFTVVSSEDCCHMYDSGRNQLCLDLDQTYSCSGNVAFACNSIALNNCAFVTHSHNCSDSYYLSECHNVKNSFACVGLRNKEYCVLNRQYTREEYEKLVPLIIKRMQASGEWGSFFASSNATFGYNETEAIIEYPLSREEAIAKGFNWSDYQKPKPDVANVLSAEDLPDHINDAPDDIVNSVIACEVTGELYRISTPELEFYRRLQIPLPRRHPDQRRRDLIEKRNPKVLRKTNCHKCSSSTLTSYPADGGQILYCKACYDEIFE